MKFYAYPLIPFTIFIALGIVCNRYVMVSYSVLLALLLFFVLFQIFLHLKNEKSWKPTSYFGVSTCLSAFVLGMLLQNIHYEPHQKNHFSHFIEDENFVSAIIVCNLKSSKKFTKHIVSISKINKENATGKLLVYIEKDSTKNVIPGTEIVFKNSFSKPFGEQNPYQFNYAQYLENNQIFDQTFLQNIDYTIVSHTKNWDYFWYNFQKKLADSFSMHRWDKKTQSVVNALLLGQRKLLDQETLTIYSDVGVIHILAISGLHVGILYFMLLWFLKPLEKTKQLHLLRFVITLTVLWSFAFITGFSASVSRAVLMFSLFTVGKLYNRNTSSFNILATSALILLIYKPNLIFDIGFQMSYAAVASILAFNPYFKYLNFSKNKIVNFFTGILAISLAAQIGVMPVSLYYFHQFSPLFLVVNLFAIPLTTVILWLSISTLVLNFTFLKLALFLGKILAFLVHLMNSCIAWFSDFKTFIYKAIPFNFGLAIAISVLIIMLLLFLKEKNVKNITFFLLGIIGFQLAFIATKIYYFNREETLIFSSKKSMITHKRNGKITAFSNDFKENDYYLQRYKMGTFSDIITKDSLQNIYKFQSKRILIIDSFAVYVKKEKIDVVVLTQNTKLNLDRLIDELQPEIIIADNSTKFYMKNYWEATCKKRKIPFHATAEKGFYTIQ